MGNHESSQHRSHKKSPGRANSIPVASVHSDPLITPHECRSPTCSSQEHHMSVQRSNSAPVRYRHDSLSSTYSTSLEGAYTDAYDGMSPTTFGGNYHKDVPRKVRAQNFDDVHGNKLNMPFDSKQGSGFDLDWQYNEKMRKRVIVKRSLNPDHPLYHKLIPRIAEGNEDSGRI
ncbi:uncharacterized protein LOC129581539 isoform X2 [Paramacrobiotus metropolitanus]|nr:uncharacterized protein LOC129581539 isoform X2 [Paramacrobiotus metropolitanus]XP_055328647.1 uncharacterized protein LOC129581539 isoform X2 [Paramacrobiotus metropolitanus]